MVLQTELESIVTMTGSIHGLKVIRSNQCFNKVQVRFPVHRKSRVLKKWRMRNSNFRFDPAAFKFGDTIYAHPALLAML